MIRCLCILVLSLTTVLAGCSLTKPDANPQGTTPAGPGHALTRFGGENGELGRLIAPRHNALKVMIASRPIEEPVLGDEVWQIADEQIVPPEIRHRLEANGLRLGVLDCPLPPTVEDLLDPTKPPPDRIDPVVFALPNGNSVPVGAGPSTAVEQLSLFFNEDGSAIGKDFHNARGAFRVTATQKLNNEASIDIRIVPEVHHGNMGRHFAADTNPAAFEPQQLIYHDGQQEESFRDLAATIALRHDQVLIIGGWPQRKGSLGHFLMTEAEIGTDRLLQKVIFLWATPTSNTAIPWVEPVTPPKDLLPVDPDELEGVR
jgi:hypothetical protein